MGFLPIIVAILGFLFLWAIVNIYSIRQRKQEAETAASGVFERAGKRNQRFQQLAALQGTDEKHSQLLQFISRQLNEQEEGQISVEEKLLAEKKVSELMADIPPRENDPIYQQTYQLLQEADQTYRRVASRYRRRASEYNDLISKNPSKILARLGGYKPIPHS